MEDPTIHSHSNSAYDLLDQFYIGRVDDSSSSQASSESSHSSASSPDQPLGSKRLQKPFIDPSKPMLSQVYFGNFSKEFYMEQVN